MPDNLDYHVEPGWRAAGNYCEPDFLVGPSGCSPTAVPPSDVLLLIEVSHWSLKFDTTIKAEMYASLGVPEYWVANAKTLSTRVHRELSRNGYLRVSDVRPSKALVPVLVPAIVLKLADLHVEQSPAAAN